MQDKEFNTRGGMSRREFLAGAALAGASLALGARARGASAPAPANAAVPAITARADGTFRILVVTDLHFFANHAVDADTLDDIKSMIDKFEPDLMIPTGDIWHNNTEGRGLEYCTWACEHLGGLGIPWAFVWGNHDSVDDYGKAHETIRTAANSLYRGQAADGNYRIALRGASGDNPGWNLMLLNDSRGGMQADQVQWFQKETAAIKAASPPPPALLFFHIPLPQYLDLARSHKARGQMLEPVSHEGGTPDALAAFRGSGFVKGMFCGHDHVNNFWGSLDGVHLEYARATGYGGYGNENCKKGGTLIQVNANTGAFKTRTVFAKGTTWNPSGFMG